jgi:hypothetical protein
MLNIAFGVILLFVAAGSVFSYFFYPKIMASFQESFAQQQAARKAERDAKIAELKTKEEKAKTKEEKAELADERATIEAVVEPDLTAFTDINEVTGMNDWRVFTYYVTELAAAIILNVLMIIAGAGLIGLTAWGRRLAILVAELKIVRQFLMVVVSMALILPISLDRTQKMYAKMEAQMKVGRGAAMPMPLSEIARMGAIAGAVMTVFGAVLASIYPALLIWFLTRPPARAACMKGLKPLEPHEQVQPGVV